MGQGDKKSIGRISLQQRQQGAEDAAPRPDVEELKSLSEKFGVPAIDLRQVCIRLSDLELFPLEIARRHVILPILVRDDRLFVAMANPHEKKVIDELEFVTDKKVFPYVALPTPLREIIEEVLLKCNYQIEEGGAQIVLPGELPTLDVDPEKMREAIAALVANALFFNDQPKGEQTIVIDCNVEPDGHRVCIRDNGIGIDPRYISQTFELGLKLDKSRGGGPGYGLYLAKRVIESHGGSISVESALNQGSTFCFTIPRRLASAAH